MAATINTIRELGYDVTPLYEDSEDENLNDVYLVQGYGISTHINANNMEMVESFCNLELHANRVYQFENPPEFPGAPMPEPEK